MRLTNPINSDVTKFLMSKIGKRNAIILFVIVFIMSLLDLIGIAIIFPFIQVITQPEAAVRLFSKVGLGTVITKLKHEQLCAVLGSALALFYVGKTIFQSFLIRTQSKLLARFTENLTNETISQLLNTRYAIFQQTPASEIAAIAHSNTIHASIVLNALLQATNEGLLLVFLLFWLFTFHPILTLAVLFFVILSSYVLYITLIRRTIKLGVSQEQVEKSRYRLLFSIASAIRDIKIMGLENFFNARNIHNSHEYSEIAWRNNFISALPRLLIELLALLGIVGAALIIVFLNIPFSEAGPLLGLAAVAALRVAPSISRIIMAVNSFKFSRAFLIRLIDLQTKLAGAVITRKEDNLTFKHSIELKNVGFKYGDTQILNNINIQLKQCEAIGIVGPSGAGKSTLLDVFTGLQPATEGKFFCDAVKFDPFTSYSIQRFIGYVPQAITLLDDTISFNVSFEDNPDPIRVMSVLDIANLREFIGSLPEGTQTRIGENGMRLSGGQRQRIGIARALFRNPKILVFDEATSSLDTLTEAELTNEIEKLRGHISVVIVAHRLSTVRSCDRIYVLSDGKIESCGTHQELLLKSQTYKKLYASQREVGFK